jgi:septal ring factor EnvC (AmiA/AmiB activator)
MTSPNRNPGALLAQLVVLIGAVSLVVPALADPDPEGRLQALKKQLEGLQVELQQDTDRRDAEVAALRSIETQAANAAAALSQTRRAIDGARQRGAELRAQRARIRGQLDRRRADLSAQARAAYASGRQERLRLVLNQQDPALLGRLLVYYRYLSELRADQIGAVVAELAELAEVDAELTVTTARLKRLEDQRTAALAEVEKARAERAAVVARLDARVRDRQQEVARLQAEQQTLEKLVAELQRTLAELPGAERDPFADQIGRLQWPVRGTLLTDYGQPRAGGSLRWNGVLVAAERGAEVRAIYHGRVAYADWLPGMGLLIVLEHGDGYMSLYGHNEVLYKQAGDWVAPGDVIAGAGDSGGRARAALYFEIRRGDKPQSPHRWFRTRLSAR